MESESLSCESFILAAATILADKYEPMVCQVKYRYESLVDQIACSTEGILMGEYDPRRAYAILKERAGL